MNDHFPGPIHSDKADSAEARRRDLKNRFRAVSRRIDGRGGVSGGGLAGGGFSPFEIALGVAALLFIGWVLGKMFGAV